MGFLTYLRRDLEQILLKDRDPHAIPSMDGAFSPNDRLDCVTPIGEPLEEADAVAEAPDGSICRFGREHDLAAKWRGLPGSRRARRIRQQGRSACLRS